MSASSFGDALFETESFEEWADNMSINVSAYYFVSAAFLGLLGAGAESRQGVSSCIVNITSTSGLAKISQDHVGNLSNAQFHSILTGGPTSPT
jgi:NAD(P)-dependent dehydrogenase (short-subunit alcohol dehydrogenase family)